MARNRIPFPLRRYALFLVLLTAIVTGCSGGGQSTPISVVLFSDLHFTPFSDQTIFPQLVEAPVEGWDAIFQQSTETPSAQWGEETNYPLMKQTVQKVCEEATDSPFIVFGGDILTHHFSTIFYQLYGSEDETALRAFIYKTVAFFATQVREYCGTIPVVFTLGNTDSYEGDYAIAPNSPFLADTSELFYSTLLQEQVDSDAFFSTYTVGGYYATDLLGSSLTVISLNTIFFSRHAAAGTEDAAAAQISWLAETLSSARSRGRHVWLLLHIPPGADIFSTIATYMDEEGQLSDATMMWKTDLQQSISELVTEYSDVISITLAGHTHMDEYRISVSESTSPHGSVIVIPAANSLFGNNPAFKVLDASSGNWSPVDYSSLSNPLDEEPQAFSGYYTFSSAFGLDDILDSALAQLADELDTEENQRATYTTHYYSGHDASNPINDINWPAYRCGITKMEKEGYIECVNAD